MADIVSTQVISDTSGVKYVVKMTNISDGSGESLVKKIDASSATFMTEDGLDIPIKSLLSSHNLARGWTLYVLNLLYYVRLLVVISVLFTVSVAVSIYQRMLTIVGCSHTSY